MTPVFEVKKTRNLFGKRRYRVNLVGRNGESLTTSEQLNSEDAARINIAATRDAAHSAVEHWL